MLKKLRKLKPMGQYILVLDQGISGSRAILVDSKGKIITSVECPLKPVFPKPGLVEYKPGDILKSQLNAIKTLFRKIGSKKKQISAIGITNQPSTIILWDKSTGKPVYNAIAYQDTRGADLCRERSVQRDMVRERTGLILSHCYTASKIKWLLDNIKPARKLLDKGNLVCGTVNTYLIWHLTRGAVFATDHTNAAHTLLFNIFTKSWDKELLELFSIPAEILPPILPTSHDYGEATIEGQTIPIHASIVEHQSSLIGNSCFEEGDVNINYGKDGFLLINTGRKIFILPGLLTTIAWSNNNNTTYMLEGSIHGVNHIFEWLRNNLGFISPKDNIDDICKRSGERVFILPALSGISSPYWNSNITTCIFGLKSTTTKNDIVRSAVESIAFLVKDNFNIIERDGRIQLKKIRASGEISSMPYLLQFQSDLLNMPVYKTQDHDAFDLGAAFLAGLNSRIWQGLLPVERLVTAKKTFNPRLDEQDTRKLYERWRLTCLYSKEWSKNFT